MKAEKGPIMDFFSTCQIIPEGVRIRVLFFTKTIPFSEIKSIQNLPLWKAFVESMNPLRPMWSTGDLSLSGVVLIETVKNGRVVLSPKNRDEFVKLVSSHIGVSS